MDEYTQLRDNWISTESKRCVVKDQVITATAKIAKAYGTGVFGAMAKTVEFSYADKSVLSGISAKEQAKGGQHFRKLGLLWKLWMNSEVALLNDKVAKEDKLKNGVALTAVEYGLNLSLVRIFKGMAGPIGAALTVLDISDSFYDEDMHIMYFNQVLSGLSEAHAQYSDGHGFYGWLLEREATEQMKAASKLRAAHEIADSLNVLTEKLVSSFNSFFRPDKPKQSSRDDILVHIDTTYNAQPNFTKVRSGSI